MALLKLAEGCYVSADQVAEAKINPYGTYINVRMKDGVTHCIHPLYGDSVYTTLDQLAAKINEATAD